MALRLFSDKKSNAPFVENDARLLEMLIRTHHGIGVYLEVRRQLPHRRNLFIDRPSPQQDVLIDVVSDLHVNGIFTFKLHITPPFRVIYGMMRPKAAR